MISDYPSNVLPVNDPVPSFKELTSHEKVLKWSIS